MSWNSTSTITNAIFTNDFSSTSDGLGNIGQNVSTYDVINTTLRTNNTIKSRSTLSNFYPIIVAELVVSIVCLILSLIIYSVLPEFRNVHGKNLISLSSCLLTTFMLLILDLILRNRISLPFCFAIAIIIHITFLATFFWTNVMAFDIWRSIASMKSKSQIKSKSRRYFKYSVYAWTATILTALPAAILELTDWVALEKRPQFGVKRCWLSGITAFIYYFNLPVGVILFGNLVMFLLTIRKIWLIKKMTATLLNKKDEQRLNLYLKLFLVMGITWLSEFLPWVTGIYWLYAVAGIITALHGFLLFIIFVLKKRILRQIWEACRFGKLPKVLKKTSTSLPITSSEQKSSIAEKESHCVHYNA